MRQGILTQVNGESWASLSHPYLERQLDRKIILGSRNGTQVVEWAENPDWWGEKKKVEMRFVSIGAVDVLINTPVAEITAAMLSSFNDFIDGNACRYIAHISYNSTIPNPPLAAIKACRAQWPDQYRWIDLSALDRNKHVFTSPELGPVGALHLKPQHYELRVGAILHKLTLLKWNP